MKDKKAITLLIVLLVGYSVASAQDSLPYNKKDVHYNAVVNIIPNRYNKVLSGLLNIAKGSHESSHIGVINYNQKNFTGFQLAALNINGGNYKGTQVSFFNFNIDTLKGTQVGIFNFTKAGSGRQIGVINYCDSAGAHSSIAYMTLIRKGGYKAIEYFVSELFPYNIAFKTGKHKTHNSITISTDGSFKNVLFGGGFGLLLKMSNRFYFNPELTFQGRIAGKIQHALSVCPKLSYEIHKRFYISVSPSFVWNRSKTQNFSTPLFDFVEEYSPNGRNKFIVGFRVGLRYNISVPK